MPLKISVSRHVTTCSLTGVPNSQKTCCLLEQGTWRWRQLLLLQRPYFSMTDVSTSRRKAEYKLTAAEHWQTGFLLTRNCPVTWPVNTILWRQSSTTRAMISTETLCVYPFPHLLAQTDITSITTYNTDRYTDTVSLDSFLQTTAICCNCHKLINHTLKNQQIYRRYNNCQCRYVCCYYLHTLNHFLFRRQHEHVPERELEGTVTRPVEANHRSRNPNWERDPFQHIWTRSIWRILPGNSVEGIPTK